MRATSKLLALALAAALQPAMAAPALDFEYIADQTAKAGEQTLNHYAGVSFSTDAWSVRSRWGDCAGNGDPAGFDFTTPAGGGCGALYLFNGNAQSRAQTSFTMSVTGGFAKNSTFSFVVNAGGDWGGSNPIVQFFSSSGDALGDAITLSNPGQCGSNEPTFCASNWQTFTADFSGVAQRMVVTGLSQGLLIDNINLVPGTTSTRLPEPASVALALVALAGVGVTRRRSAN